MDAAHFVFAPFLGYLWCFARLFIKAPSGRKRFNVLGALNAISHEMIVITNTGYINAYSVCSLLMKISQKYGELPISIVLDNADIRSVNWFNRLQNCLTLNCCTCRLTHQTLT